MRTGWAVWGLNWGVIDDTADTTRSLRFRAQPKIDTSGKSGGSVTLKPLVLGRGGTANLALPNIAILRLPSGAGVWAVPDPDATLKASKVLIRCSCPTTVRPQVLRMRSSTQIWHFRDSPRSTHVPLHSKNQGISRSIQALPWTFARIDGCVWHESAWIGGELLLLPRD